MNEINDPALSHMVALEQLRKVETILSTAYDWMSKHADHPYDCPRNRDDYDCTCGFSDLIYDIELALDIPTTAT